MTRAMPEQKPGRSEQIVATDPEFARAVEGRFGPMRVDLAANASNTLGSDYYFGPGSNRCEDALAEACRWPTGCPCWLNPPFDDIAPWAAKCVAASAAGSRIALLVPASVGSLWFNRYVRPHAYVLELTPRLTFVGHTSSYPKDLVLCYYAPERLIGRDLWVWKTRAANDNGRRKVNTRQLVIPGAVA